MFMTFFKSRQFRRVFDKYNSELGSCRFKQDFRLHVLIWLLYIYLSKLRIVIFHEWFYRASIIFTVN